MLAMAILGVPVVDIHSSPEVLQRRWNDRHNWLDRPARIVDLPGGPQSLACPRIALT
jgi:hypothetical protein